MTPDERRALRTMSASDLTKAARAADAALIPHVERLCLADHAFNTALRATLDIEDEQIRRRTAR